jgi:hypothetical protein
MENLHFNYDLKITQGDDRSIIMVFEDDDEPPVEVEIDGWLFSYTAKRVHDDSATDENAVIVVEDTAIVRSHTGTGGATYDTITIPIDSTQTGDADPGSYLHEIERTVSGKVSTIMKGTIVIDPQVTNRPPEVP